MKDGWTQSTKERSVNDNDGYLISQINEIKSQLYSINPADFEKLRNLVDNLLISQHISSELREMLERLQSTILEHEQQAQAITYSSIESQNRETASSLQDAMIEYVENEAREIELKELTVQYAAFKDIFIKDLKERNQLLQRALNGKLTEQEKAELMGQYASKEEEEAARRKQQEIDRRWAMHYSIEDKATKSITYRQNEIAKNNQVINHFNTPPRLKTDLSKENEVHKQAINNHKKALESLKEANKERETHRECINALADSGQIELAIKELKKHYNCHGKKYDEEKRKDPHHKGYSELHSLIMSCGGHEKLGLPKPKDLILDPPVSPIQNIKNSTLVQTQTNVFLPPLLNLNQRHLAQAEAIKANLSQNQSIAKPNEKAGLIGAASNKMGSPIISQDKNRDKEIGKDVMSKFSQRRKSLEGHSGR